MMDRVGTARLAFGFSSGFHRIESIRTLHTFDFILVVWVWHGPTWVGHGLARTVSLQRPRAKPLKTKKANYAVPMRPKWVELRWAHWRSQTHADLFN